MKKVAVIGGGNWGKNLIRTFYELGVLQAVAEANDELREGLAKQYSDITFYTSHEEVLASNIEAVAIATPVFTHFELAKQALQAGKDVFVEKPMTETEEGARVLKDLADSLGRVLMVGHMLLFQPAMSFIKQFIIDGKLGRVFAYHQTRKNLGTIRTRENALFSLGVHDVAVLDYLVGEEPMSVQSQGQQVTTKGVEDEVTLHIAYPSGVQAHLYLSWLWPYKERHLMVQGEKGALFFDELNAKVTWLKNHGNADATVTTGGAEVVFEGADKPLTLELQHFLECLETRELPRSHAEQGRRVVDIMEKTMKDMRITCMTA